MHHLKDNRMYFPPILFIIIPLLMLLSTLMSRLAVTEIPVESTTKAPAVRVVFPPSPNLAKAARTHPETCSQWISAQRSIRSYLDAFVIGAQKSGTTELSRRLGDLGVRRGRRDMLKEWRSLYQIDEHGKRQANKTPNQTFITFTADSIPNLRLTHFRSGHPDHPATDPNQLPLVDNRPIAEREITYDGTPEYLISERSAQLAHLLAPHARLLLLMRDPIERAISQYNMVVRIANSDRSEETLLKPNPAEFHYFIETEVNALRECGYNADLAHYAGNTTELQQCVIERAGNPRLHLFRGLYGLHIQKWLRYFPAHRFLFVRFSDILGDPEKHLKEVTRFLCIRDFPPSLISEYTQKDANVSFGQATAMFGAEGVQDDFGGEGQTQYMVDIWDKTRQMMEDVVRGSNKKVEWLLGEKCC